jgi:hypothetical protein
MCQGLEGDHLIQPSESVRCSNERLIAATQTELAFPSVCERKQIAFARVQPIGVSVREAELHGGSLSERLHGHPRNVMLGHGHVSGF